MKWCLISIAFLTASVAHAEVSKNHIVLIQADQDNLFGTYYFALVSPSDGAVEAPQPVQVMLPKETSEIKPGMGIVDSDLSLDGEGRLWVTPPAKSGINLVGINFRVERRRLQHDRLTFVAVIPMGQLSIASPKKGGVDFVGDGFTIGIPAMLSSDTHQGIIRSDVAPGETMTVQVLGLPIGRELFWLAGIIWAVLLILFAALFAIKTLPARENALTMNVEA